MNEIFLLRHQNQYSLRNWVDFCVHKIGSINHDSESVRCLGPEAWTINQHMPEESDTINQFKITILKNGNQNLVYVDHVKFICKI